MKDQRAIDAALAGALEGRVGRRDFIKRATLLGLSVPALGGLLAACGDEDDPEDVGAEEPDDDTDEEPTDDEPEEEVEEDDEDVELDDDDEEEIQPETDDIEVMEVEGIADIPRNRTLIMRWAGVEGRFVDHEIWNPYAIGGNHQNGSGILYEPLAFYSAFADEEMLWLAEGYEYNDDFTQLTIRVREGIEWSDGEPFSAEDVAFTINSLNELGATVRWGVDVQQVVEQAEAVSDTEVVVDFVVPSPRFFFLMTYRFDIGVYIVPKHIYEDVEWDVYTAFDVDEGLPVTTSCWRVVFSSPEQKVIDRRDSWWAVDQGLVEQLPDVERVIYLPFGGEDQTAQAHLTNQIDFSSGLTPATMELILNQNPALTTHSGRESPYGYVDWWPMGLFLNHEWEPWEEVNLRWAVSYYLDREQIVEVAESGAGSLFPLFIPSYPALVPFVDYVEDLLEEWNPIEYNPDRGDELMMEAGFEKNDDGLWERDGEVISLEMMGAAGRQLLGPVVSEQLRRAGFDAEFSMPPDWSDLLSRGEFEAGFNGHGGSVSGDPYYSLRLYQSATAAVPGAHQVNFSRWVNEEYDEIVDEMAVTSPDDTDALMDQFRRAMEVWLPELPAVMINEFYHRIPMNTTYWENWPTEDNNYVNGAFWHLTFQLVLNNLRAVED
jgi:peptide/nickel transport system substrate-binding protein